MTKKGMKLQLLLDVKGLNKLIYVYEVLQGFHVTVLQSGKGLAVCYEQPTLLPTTPRSI